MQIKPAIDAPEMLKALAKQEENTEFVAFDLANATYERTSEYGELTCDSKKFTLTEWSARQLCRKAGVPFGFFRKASGPLAGQALGELIPQAKDAQAKLALKHYSGKTILRGVLPVDYPDIRNSEVLSGVTKAAGGYLIESAPWLDKVDDPWLRTRYVDPEVQFQVGNEELTLGLDVTTSELGGGPLQVNLLLFRPICTNGAMVLFEQKPFFNYDYATVFGYDVPDVVAKGVDRLCNEVDQIHTAVKVAMDKAASVSEATQIFEELTTRGVLNKGVARKAITEAEQAGVTNAWGLVNALTSASRGFRDGLRLKYEQVAGHLLGLNFARKTQAEQAYGEKGKALVVPGKLIN